MGNRICVTLVPESATKMSVLLLSVHFLLQNQNRRPAGSSPTSLLRLSFKRCSCLGSETNIVCTGESYLCGEVGPEIRHENFRTAVRIPFRPSKLKDGQPVPRQLRFGDSSPNGAAATGESYVLVPGFTTKISVLLLGFHFHFQNQNSGQPVPLQLRYCDSPPNAAATAAKQIYFSSW